MHTGATIKTTGQQTSLEKWKVWDEHKYLVKEKKAKKKRKTHAPPSDKKQVPKAEQLQNVSTE